MGLIERLTSIGNAMRSGDGETKLYTLPEMAQRPGVWQTEIAEAITSKGVDTLPDSSFDTMAINIGLIQTDSQDFKVFKKTLTLSSESTANVTLISQEELLNADLIPSLSKRLSDKWDDVKIIVYFSSLGTLRTSYQYVIYGMTSYSNMIYSGSDYVKFISAISTKGSLAFRSAKALTTGIPCVACDTSGVYIYPGGSAIRCPIGTAEVYVMVSGKK